MCDAIQSAGIIGGPYVHNQAKPVELVFANPDLIWRSEFERPRLGQGGFREAFGAVYKVRHSPHLYVDGWLNLCFQALTGAEHPYTQYGKPTTETYDFAKRVLADRVGELYGVPQLPSSM